MTDVSRPWDLCVAVLAAIQTEFTTRARPLPPRQFATTGVVIYDAEQLSVTLIRLFGMEGGEAEYVQQCTVWRGAEFEVMLLRCAPTVQQMVDGSVRAPTAAQQSTYGELVATDAQVITLGLLAGFRAGSFGLGPTLTLGSWSATNEADLGGGALRFKLSLV